jgi:hypothetical protein
MIGILFRMNEVSEKCNPHARLQTTFAWHIFHFSYSPSLYSLPYHQRFLPWKADQTEANASAASFAL